MRAPIVVPGLAVIAATLMPPPALPADDPVSLRRHALEQPGDPERGRQLFQSLQPLACSSCHRVGADGGDAGPDLSAIGNKSDRPHLIESLLDPSRQIVEGYRTTMIAMRNGRVLSGVVRDETDDSLRLVDALAATTTIRKPEIAERKLSELSLMPDDLVSGLDAQSFTDLVAYLASLRPGRKPTPGEVAVDPFSLPPGFRARRIAEGLSAATALEVTRDGKVLICEQEGTLRLVANDRL